MRYFKKLSWLAFLGVFLGISGITSDALAQTISNCDRALGEAYLDVNNVRARILNGGGLFYRGEPHVYEVPKGSGSNAIFASGIWVAGQVGGQLRAAATRYGEWEFWAGPLDDSGNPPADCSIYDRVYKLSRSDVKDYEAGGSAIPDLRDWPTGLGAPTWDANGDLLDILSQTFDSRVGRVIDLAAGERPALLGDQSIWWVMNDRGNIHKSTDAPPIGLEAHGMAFAFDVAGDIGNATFYKINLFYKGNVPLENAYISLFSDPDMGNFDDDYVGSDSVLGLGYVYNSDNADEGGEGYGTPPPAVGYDFFQGPIVPAPGETAYVSGVPVADHKNLQMTSFVFYNNGGGVMEDPRTGPDYYNYMQANWKDGKKITFGGDGRNFSNIPTNYMFPSDPSKNEFWTERNADGAGTSNDPADRRFVMSSGPFTISPGDQQEIVFGLVYALGADNWDSVPRMKQADALAQAAFDVNFILPQAPDRPIVMVTELDQEVILEWANAPNSNNFLETFYQIDPFADLADNDYNFEGYKIYEFTEAGDQAGKVIATYDVANDVDRVVDGFPGEPSEVVMDGENNGTQLFHKIGALTNYKTYYYGIQAFAYNELSYPKIFPSPIVRVEAIPRRGEANLSDDAIEAALTFTESDFEISMEGKGQGVVSVDIVNPAAIIDGATYTVEFYEMELAGKREVRRRVETEVFRVDDLLDDGEITAKFGSSTGTTYDIKRDGTVLFDGNIDGAIAPQRQKVIVFDGIQFSITGPDPGWKDFTVVANAAGPVDPPSGASADWRSFPGTGRGNSAQQVGDGIWHIATGMSGGCPSNCGNYDSFLVRSMRDGWDLVAPFDFEIRFTATGSLNYDRFGLIDGNIQVNDPLPFEIWMTGISTPDDTSDDVRLIPAAIDWDADGWGLTDEDHSSSGGANDPNTDWFYWYQPDDMSPGTAGYDAWAANALAGGNPEDLLNGEIMARFVFYNWNGGDTRTGGPYDQLMPEEGTVFRLETLKPNQPGDVFSFNTAGFGTTESTLAQKQDKLKDIGVSPNPYKGASSYERSQLIDEVRFTNLPSERTTLRIFTLNGTLIRTIIKPAGVDQQGWDLTTGDTLPIASGIYLIHVDVDDVGEHVIKFAVVKKRIHLNTF